MSFESKTNLIRPVEFKQISLQKVLDIGAGLTQL